MAHPTLLHWARLQPANNTPKIIKLLVYSKLRVYYIVTRQRGGVSNEPPWLQLGSDKTLGHKLTLLPPLGVRMDPKNLSVFHKR